MTDIRQLLRWTPLVIAILLNPGCADEKPKAIDFKVTQLEPEVAAQHAAEIRQRVSAQVIDGLELSLWASDSLAPDPIALTIDPQGRVYITGTNRRRTSEIDIRGHRDWMTASIAMQSVEDRRKFIHDSLAPAHSAHNEWLADLNEDGSHDWRDLTVQKEQVFRIEDRDGDGIADRSQVVVEDFHTEVTDIAGALLIDGKDMFVGVAPDMWRLRDEDGDGFRESKESISHGYQVHMGFGGHNMSGLVKGPDGRIYWGIGDIGINVVDREGKRWFYPNQGVIVRANPDGSDFEVFAAGLRNTHEFVFDEFGNIISVDNDGDHPGEMERLVYIVNGSDSGWRINWQFGKYTDPDNNDYKVWMDEEYFKPRFEGQAAFLTPPIANYHSGPAGMKYNPGTALSDEWKNHFFVSEFTGSPARSRIFAFRLRPKGAGFEFVDEKEVLKGVLVTGLDFGPDGALYLGDWIDGWVTKDYGRVWKLDDPTPSNDSLRKETRTLLAETFDGKNSAELSSLLGHPDMRVRQKAQFSLAKRGEEGSELLWAAAQSGEGMARIHGLWGLWQLARQDAAYADNIQSLLADDTPEIRAQAAKILGDIRHSAAGEALVPMLRDTSLRVRFFAAEALGRISYTPAVQPLINLLEENNDEDTFLRHAGALALARIGQTEPLIALADHPSRALRLAAVVALRRMQDPGVARFLNDPDEYVVTEAARAINDDYSIEEALPDLARLLNEPRFTNEALLRRAINANLRVGQEENLAILTEFATRTKAPADMRKEAIATLGVWPRPSVHDRVDGRYRGVIQRDPEPVRRAAEPILSTLLADTEPVVRISAAQTADRLKITTAGSDLFALVRKDPQPKVRTAALEALCHLEGKQTEQALEIALKDRSKEVRSSALALIPAMNLPPARSVDLFATVLEGGTLEEQQTALTSLGKLPPENTQKVLERLIGQLTAGKLDPGLQLDLFEAIEASGSETLQNKLRAYRETQPVGDPLALYRGCLEGGDAEAGRRIFTNDEAAQCVRCHAVGDWGGDVGPQLTGIARQLSREELLLSLVDPSARIAPGYGFVSLTLKNGETAGGILMEETDESVVIQIQKGESRTIPKTDIAEREEAPSSMPPMGNILNRRELRDLVAFLVTLEGEES